MRAAARLLGFGLLLVIVVAGAWMLGRVLGPLGDDAPSLDGPHGSPTTSAAVEGHDGAAPTSTPVPTTTAAPPPPPAPAPPPPVVPAASPPAPAAAFVVVPATGPTVGADHPTAISQTNTVAAWPVSQPQPSRTGADARTAPAPVTASDTDEKRPARNRYTPRPGANATDVQPGTPDRDAPGPDRRPGKSEGKDRKSDR